MSTLNGLEIRRPGAGICSLVIVLLAALGLGGCVTETQSAYTKEVTTEDAVQSHVNAAMKYLRQGDTENAMRHLKSAYDRDPDSAEVHNGMALVFQVTGEKELAEEHYKDALRADRDMTSARNNYAVFLYGEGRYPEACKQMRRVIEDTLYEGRASAFQNLGQCELKLGELEAAENAFERAFALNRRQPQVLLELSNVNIQQGDYVTAQKYYSQYRQLGPKSARSLYIGIQLADYFEDEDGRASLALALKNMYPTSEEYVRYRNEQGNDTKYQGN